MIPGRCPASRRGKAHECIRKQLCRQGHRVLMNKSNICQQCASVGKAANQMWVCINEIGVSRSRGVALPPQFSGCKTTAEYSSAVHGSQVNPLDVQKQAQRQISAIISMPEHMTFQERQKKLGLFRLKKRRPRRESYCCLQLSCAAKMMSELSEAHSKTARGIKYKLQQSKFQSHIRDSMYLFLQEWPNMGTWCPETQGTHHTLGQ